MSLSKAHHRAAWHPVLQSAAPRACSGEEAGLILSAGSWWVRQEAPGGAAPPQASMKSTLLGN